MSHYCTQAATKLMTKKALEHSPVTELEVSKQKLKLITHQSPCEGQGPPILGLEKQLGCQIRLEVNF